MQRQVYSGTLARDEQRAFVPFLHELIGTAFGVIGPLFLRDLDVERKGDRTPVTEADRGAEQAMRRLIEARYPDHGILGEEYGQKPGGRYRWILDPIDGTKAFISHCFLFGTLIALERDDGDGFRPILGAIAHAAAGVALIGHAGGTRLYRSDGRQEAVRVRAPRPLDAATVLMTTLPGSGEQGADAALAAVAARARLARSWGDCFGYFALATGGADVMLDPVLSYWDVAAIVPVVEGAGGRICSWSGGDPLREPSAIATTGALHDEVLALVRAA